MPQWEVSGGDDVMQDAADGVVQKSHVARIKIVAEEEDVDEEYGDDGDECGERLRFAQVSGIVTACLPFGNSAITRNSSAAPSKLVLCSFDRGSSCL